MLSPCGCGPYLTDKHELVVGLCIGAPVVAVGVALLELVCCVNALKKTGNIFHDLIVNTSDIWLGYHLKTTRLSTMNVR